MKIYTIGHSTRELDDFIEILKTYRIDYLIDIRTVPKSAHVPQFNEDNLAKEMPKAGINYTHLAALGGLRHTTKDSINTAWRNKSFRGYADYMQTEQFTEGIDQLLNLACEHNPLGSDAVQGNQRVVAIMCAEAVPWRCHRSLVGDALLVRGHTVIDIFDKDKSVAEKITDFAKVDGIKISYPAQN